MSRNRRNHGSAQSTPPRDSDGCQQPDASSSGTRSPSAETERDVLLRLIPDQVFRIKAMKDGTVAVEDGRTRTRLATEPPQVSGDMRHREGGEIDCCDGVAQQLACRGRQLIDGFLGSGEMQTLEIEGECGGRTTRYEVRAAACGPWEIMAVVTDVTARKEAEASIARALREVARLNEILQNEAAVHAEDEQIMDNAFAKLGKLLEDTIGAIQMIVQQKHPPTARHQARVCRLACAVAREMGLGKSQVDTIGLAALLHDLGKVFVPTETLDKPGRLTVDEFETVKNSAEMEFQILKTIDLFYPIADIVHQHHERLDGSGYPLGLTGEDIMLEARIIALSDVVEAMVSERPYRPALTLEAALYEIRAGKGTLYDADAVDACVRLFEQRGFEFAREEDSVAQEAAHTAS